MIYYNKFMIYYNGYIQNKKRLPRTLFSLFLAFTIFQTLTTVVLVAHKDEVISIHNDADNGSQGKTASEAFSHTSQSVPDDALKQAFPKAGGDIVTRWETFKSQAFVMFSLCAVACGFVYVADNWNKWFTAEGRAKQQRHDYARKIIEGEAYIKLREMRGYPQATYEDLLPKRSDRGVFQFIVQKISCYDPLEIFNIVVSSHSLKFEEMVEKLTMEEIEQLAHFINTMATNLDAKAEKAQKIQPSEEREKQDRRKHARKIIEGAGYKKLRCEIENYSYDDLLPLREDRKVFKSIIEKFWWGGDPLEIFREVLFPNSPRFEQVVEKLTKDDIERFAHFINTMVMNMVINSDEKAQHKGEELSQTAFQVFDELD